MVRKPAVAGQFYTADKVHLKKEIAGFTTRKKDLINAIGVISPHAGYMYSGPVAGEVLSSIKPKPSYIILGPNHTGMGKAFGLDADSTWETPIGETRVNGRLAEAILSRSKYIEKDTTCHRYEHSIEVQLPFLQSLADGFTFVPIVVSPASREAYKDIGKGLATAIKDLEADVTIIASSDMTHYEPHDAARKKDMLVIDKILALDIDVFLDTVEKYDVSMCGFAPAAIMLQAALELGATKAKLVKYSTSGETSGDYAAVVGYAGIVVY